MKRLITALSVFLLISSVVAASDWQQNLQKLVKKGFENVASATAADMAFDMSEIEKTAAEAPSWQDLSNQLQNREYTQPENRGKLELHNFAGKDGKVRPWVLYVPETYWHKRPTPALIVLHGGVSRAELSDDPVEWASGSAFLTLARQNGWFAVFPFGQDGATWWDDVGMSNIRSQLQLVKETFNIDDDRVYLAGFSDGASGGFLHAMVAPDDFAAIVALNGHMGVGSLDGKLPTYAPNMTNTPIYAVTTDKDGLYPTAIMNSVIKMAQTAGASIFYRQLAGTHSFDYADTELPLIERFLDCHPREIMPTKIFWETGDTRFGRCRWLQVTKVLPIEPAEWHIDHNLAMMSDRITVGFMPETASAGVKVGKVIEETYAQKIGLQTGDIIVKANNVVVKDSDDLDTAKAGVKRGDQFDITVIRDEKAVELKGTLPDPELFYIFKREVPSAAVIASLSGNNITIKGSRLGRFNILITAGQFNLAEKLVITCDGNTVYNDFIKPDKEFMLENYLANRDRKLLPIAKIAVDLGAK
ncbi:MAG: PDZ domain-containing protein [Candidatus Riflebacteria bacterium]|nr:PDZ domain-containing protein [Candidatus Riflebacteria bacterium]